MSSCLRPVVFSALLLLPALAQAEPQAARRAFYFWRTTFDLGPSERATLTRQRVERLYLRFFDVGLKPGTARAVPLGRVAFAHDVPAGLQVVPVVYLANAVFEANTEPVALADQVLAEVTQVAQLPATSISFDELQVDCDWTVGTRAAFFRFCQRLREQLAAAGKTLSATIRLHQVKYAARTGVPPVGRGMLMFYNLGALSLDGARSSIFDEATAKKYTASLKGYPLPLDAALPIFGWAIHARAGRIVGLIKKLDQATLQSLDGVTQVAPGRFTVVRAQLVDGLSLQAGDTLLLEVMDASQSTAAAQVLAQAFTPTAPFFISLFDLDDRNLKTHGPADLDAVFDAVRGDAARP